MLARVSLEHALDKCVIERGASRIRRFCRHPLILGQIRIYRSLGLTRRVSVPTFWGGTFHGVVPEAVTTMVMGQGYTDEPVCRALLRHLSTGSVFVDVGAHFGFFSLLASKLVGPEGQVVSVEAMPETFEQLTANLGSAPNVRTVQCAASDKSGTLTFNDFGLVDCALNSAFSSRGNRHTSVQRTIAVQALPLDSICHGIRRVDLVKIDAESSEHLVIAGMTELIDEFRPAICVEVSDASDVEARHSRDIIEMLRCRGYEPVRLRHGEFVEASGPIGYDNYLFVHRAAGGKT